MRSAQCHDIESADEKNKGEASCTGLWIRQALSSARFWLSPLAGEDHVPPF